MTSIITDWDVRYGVSRVYSHQCGYTLTDVQAMHDKMRAMFKVLPGGGLDPGAGKARPDQLVIQDDPSFVPEINLQGLGVDISKLTLVPEVEPSRQGSFLLTQSPNTSQTIPENFNLQLEFSSDNILGDPDGGGFGSERAAPLGRISTSAVDNEAGVLLQPDFEFDEDGNIIELAQDRRPGHTEEEHGGRQIRETPRPGQGQVVNDISLDEQPMVVDEDDRDIRPNPMTPQVQQPVQSSLPAEATPEVIENDPNAQEVADGQARNPSSKSLQMDEQTAFRNTELAQINNEYLQNMALILKQKAQNKVPAQAKKTAAFWVFGQGIGSVGVGLGASHIVHPLHVFSGDELLGFLHFEQSKRGARKRGRPSDEESDSETGRRVRRARGESEEQTGRGVRISHPTRAQLSIPRARLILLGCRNRPSRSSRSPRRSFFADALEHHGVYSKLASRILSSEPLPQCWSVRLSQHAARRVQQPAAKPTDERQPPCRTRIPIRPGRTYRS